MSEQAKNTLRDYGPVLLGFIFAILQGFTVYFTRNVETSVSKLEDKLDNTWNITLVTQTKVTALEARTLKVEQGQAAQQKELQDVRELVLSHVTAPKK